MEMQLQEFPSASMSGSAASNEPELITSTATSPSASLSSRQTDPSMISGADSSPAYSSPPAAPSPPPPPPSLQPQDGPYHIISIPSLPAIPCTTRPTPSPIIRREEALNSIRESIPHTMRYKELQKSERNHQRDASKSKKEARRQSKDVFLILSMYALLQSALFTAVATSSMFTCEDLWGPTSIVGAVMLATGLATLDKLRDMAKHRQDAKRSESCRNAVYSKIKLLLIKGSSCEIESLEPQYQPASKYVEPGIMGVCTSVHGLLVLGFLLGFSTLMVVCCIYMLMDCTQ